MLPIKETIHNRSGGRYMTRWIFFLPNPYFNIYLHKFHASDDTSVGMHDHPWNFLSIVLKGCYREMIRYKPGGFDNVVSRRWLSVAFRRAESAHYVLLEPGKGTTWSLLFTGRRRRIWGFYTPSGWRPHNQVVGY